VQCKAQWYYESPSRQLKNEGEKIEIGAMHLYTLPSAVAVRLQNTSHRHRMNSQIPTKWHSKPRALRAVEVHPDRKSSSECKLCGESSIRYIHVLNWKMSEVAHLQNWAPDVSHWDCICRNCGEEFKRNASKDEYIPRWVCKN